MKDNLIRVISDEANVRAMACLTTATVGEACVRHRTSPTASVALGRALTGGVLLGALLKGRQRVALKFEGNGPLGKIVVEADPMCLVHGYVGNPGADLPLRDGRFDIPGALGRAGLLTVTKDLQLKSPYQGVVNLVSSEIAEDIAYYLTESEQTPSAMGLTTIPDDQGGIAVAGGFLLQSLPPANDAALETLTARIAAMPPLARLLFDGAGPKDILDHIFGDIPYEILGHQDVAFHCGCSRDRIEQALITLGVDEIKSLAERGEDTVITCEFCREPYAFTPADLRRLADERH
ncbi:Hsp33 family molecular chaperone HslO [Desulfomicrobium escambiense]|uniref:Hsp33 family molecular chaperone HslO n=1 Tax=Desulfomicrobium escambiense TaxID=29503 RepID=UPI0004181869|nr:Hsp33 family molecular chaperone HslO [Desulfomicrobium escambiense]